MTTTAYAFSYATYAPGPERMGGPTFVDTNYPELVERVVRHFAADMCSTEFTLEYQGTQHGRNSDWHLFSLSHPSWSSPYTQFVIPCANTEMGIGQLLRYMVAKTVVEGRVVQEGWLDSEMGVDFDKHFHTSETMLKLRD